MSIPLPPLTANQVEKVDEWLRAVLWENELPPNDSGTHSSAFEIHRMKGRLVMKGGGQKMVQGVREVFEIMDSPTTNPDESPPVTGKIVLIGRHLKDTGFQNSLLRAIGNSGNS